MSYADIQEEQLQKALRSRQRARPVAREGAEQRAVIEWARLQAGAYPELEMLWHTPNGGKRPGRTAAIMKLEGVKEGVPDLFLACARQGYHGLFIELKTMEGHVSDAQDNMIAKLRAQGYKVVVAYGQDQAKTAICMYLGIAL